jgi:predicted DNA-binding protein
MHQTTTKTTPTLTETIALRLPLDECRALVVVAKRDDRTISYVVRNLIRTFLHTPQQAA